MTSTAKISRDSNNSNFAQNSVKIPISGFLGANKKPNVKKIYKRDGQNDLLTLQIKYAISKISSEYTEKKNDLIKLPFCYYYCNYNYNAKDFINNKNDINNNEKRSKNNNKFNNYYNKFSVGFKNNNYK